MKQTCAFLLFLGLFTLSSCQEKNTNQAPSLPIVSDEATEVSPTMSSETKSLPHYICYNNDSQPDLALSIYFNENGKAQKARYKGQSESLKLIFEREEYIEGGAHPTIIGYYTEMYKGQKNGTYKLSHSGIWDYADYASLKDNKTFEFTINHELSIVKDTYRGTPCY